MGNANALISVLMNGGESSCQKIIEPKTESTIIIKEIENGIIMGLNQYLEIDTSEAFLNNNIIILAHDYLLSTTQYRYFTFVFPYESVNGSNSFIRLVYNYYNKKIVIQANGEHISNEEMLNISLSEVRDTLSTLVAKWRVFWKQ